MNEQDPELPVIPATAAVQQLVPESSGTILIKPETRVLCIHRGRRLTQNGHLVAVNPKRDPNNPETVCVGDYTDTYDSKHYIIRPGYFEVEYGCAVHFRNRAVVPGSRNPETQFQASFIAIVGVVQATPEGMKVLKAVDPQEEWTPFTDEECAQYEVAFEALDRSSMTNPIDPEVKVVSATNMLGGAKDTAPSRVKGGPGNGRSGGRRTQLEATDPDILKPIPPEENSVVRGMKADAAQAAAEGHKVD